MVEYVQQLREGILEAYVGIASGFRSPDKCTSILFVATHYSRLLTFVYFHRRNPASLRSDHARAVCTGS